MNKLLNVPNNIGHLCLCQTFFGGNRIRISILFPGGKIDGFAVSLHSHRHPVNSNVRDVFVFIIVSADIFLTGCFSDTQLFLAVKLIGVQHLSQTIFGSPISGEPVSGNRIFYCQGYAGNRCCFFECVTVNKWVGKLGCSCFGLCF